MKDSSVLYNSKAIMLLYTLLALRLSTNEGITSVIREMTNAKKNQRYRLSLNKILRGMQAQRVP